MATDMTTTTHDTAWEGHCARMQRGVYGLREFMKNSHFSFFHGGQAPIDTRTERHFCKQHPFSGTE